MAKILLNSVVIFTIFISSTLVTCNNKPDTFCQSISPSSLGLQNVKLSHIRVFRQTYTALSVATANSSDNFGSLSAIDIPLTKGLDTAPFITETPPSPSSSLRRYSPPPSSLNDVQLARSRFVTLIIHSLHLKFRWSSTSSTLKSYSNIPANISPNYLVHYTASFFFK
ncbi:hypothetical protein ACFE04_022542 [Oxalis oulophora]